MTNSIVFRTFAQKILFDTELSGQLSDGVWENSLPYDHWKLPCNADVKVDANQQGLTFYPRRKYSFANRTLIEVCGQRMINAVKFFTTFPELHEVVNDHVVRAETNFVDFANEIEKALADGDQKNVYYYNRAVEVMKGLNVTTIEQLRAKLLPVVNVDYNEKQMRKDLREMSDLFNDTYSRKRLLRAA